MSGSFGVGVLGPLEDFAERFAAELSGLGYSWRGGEAQLRLMAHLSRWMSAQGLAAGELGAGAVDRFAVARRGSHRGLRSPRALVPLLGHLRSIGAVPPEPVVAATIDPAEGLLERFGRCLDCERGLAAATVRSYVSQVRPFARQHADEGWGVLSERQVTAFVTACSLAQPPRSVAVRANALRALLRFLWREGSVCSPSLADAVGKIVAATQSTPPRALSAAELGAVAAALPSGPARARNEAMLTLMWRLGLRAGRSSACSCRTLTGGPGPCWCAANARASISCRFRWTSASSWRAISRAGDLVERRIGKCSWAWPLPMGR